jgi:putative ABC transport system permease protein
MGQLRILSARLRGLLRREAVIGDIDEEMRCHLEMEVEANVGRGMPPVEARRAALRSFGNVDSVRQRAWEVRGGGMLETFFQDLRYGARVLARNPAFTAVAVLTLALGIGANTAIFSVVDQLLLRPLPYPGADRLVLLWEVTPSGRHQNPVSYANFLAWRRQARSFEGMAAFADQRANLTGIGEPEEVVLQFATPGLFRVLGFPPVLGRGFTPQEVVEDGPRVAVLSHAFWRQRLGGDPKVIGRIIQLNSEPYAVVGVLPAGFQWHIQQGSTTGRPAEVWVPLPLPTEGPGTRGRFLSVVARLKPGVSPARAGAEMKTLAARLAIDAPKYNKDFGEEVLTLREQLVGEVRPALLILLGAVGLVLLIACANVSNLLLARAAAREKEIALRAAVGARRLRVVRQLLTESLLLSALGSLLGLVFAWWGLRALVAISPRELVNLRGVGLNLPVLGVTLAVSLATGFLFGLVPALESARLNLNGSLKEGGKGSAGQGARNRRLRNALVIAEVALALVLLAGAGLLIKSFVRLQEVDPGFHRENLLTMVVRLPGGKYEEDRQLVAFFHQAAERIRAVPGVRGAGTVSYLPFYGGPGSATSFSVEGRPAPPPGEAPTTDVRVTDAGYFGAMGIPLLQGRNFTGVEVREARHVVLVNAAMARQIFPGENPLGKRILVEMSSEAVPTEIVGIVGDVKFASLAEEVRPTVYMPMAELPYSLMTLVIRTTGDPGALAPTARRVLREIDPDQPVSDIRTMNQVMSEAVGRNRFNTLLLGLFAGLATLLAAVGIFGVMSSSVTLRTREIGLRVALGARQGQVLALILKQGLLLTLAGVALGLAGAVALTRLLAGLLFGVGSTDPATFTAIALLLTLVSAIACYIPARRAARVDPLIALRYD